MDPKELRKFAAECLQMALSASPEEATRLRTMAREMMDMAGDGQPSQQQQQIQPKKQQGEG
jgi:hypothetical protein